MICDPNIELVKGKASLIFYVCHVTQLRRRQPLCRPRRQVMRHCGLPVWLHQFLCLYNMPSKSLAHALTSLLYFLVHLLPRTLNPSHFNSLTCWRICLLPPCLPLPMIYSRPSSPFLLLFKLCYTATLKLATTTTASITASTIDYQPHHYFRGTATSRSELPSLLT